MIIPLHKEGSWQALNFRSIPHNQVIFGQKGMTISVDKSSSPLIYPLQPSEKIKKISLKATVTKGSLNIPKGMVQGDKGADDFIMKLGLVKKGKKTLNWLQRQAAPSWVLKLHSLAPKGTGVEHIQFLALTSQEATLGKKRTHPLSDLLFEDNIQLFRPGQDILLEKTFNPPLETLGLWISADGDDTGSTFQVQVQEIRLETDAP